MISLKINKAGTCFHKQKLTNESVTYSKPPKKSLSDQWEG